MNKKEEIKRAAKLLPHGAVLEISFNTRMAQSTVSRILQGNEMKGSNEVKKQLVAMLQKLRNDIDVVLVDLK